MQKLKKLGVMSVAKVYAVIAAIYVVVPGMAIAILGAGFASIMGAANYGPGAEMFAGFGIASIIVLPILFAVFGFIAGAICAFIFNIVVKFVGGIEIELE